MRWSVAILRATIGEPSAWKQMPTIPVRPPRSARPSGLGTKPSCTIAARTRWQVSGFTSECPFKTREIVQRDNPRCRANAVVESIGVFGVRGATRRHKTNTCWIVDTFVVRATAAMGRRGGREADVQVAA